METPLRVAIFGAGGFAINHINLIEQFQAEGLVRFVAVADPYVDKLADLKCRLETSGVHWFEDYRSLLDTVGDKLDAVIISTPIPLHLPMLEAALDRQLTVFLEKPPVPLLQDFLRIAERAESARVALGFKMLADPNVWRLKQAMLEGSLGSLRRVSATGCWPRLDAYYGRADWAGRVMLGDMAVLDGPATNALAHIIHHIMFLGADELEGFAVPNELCGELYRARAIESYDTCCLRGAWNSGVEFTAAFTHATESRVEWALVVEGERGSAVLNAESISFQTSTPVPPALGPVRDPFYLGWLDFLDFARGRIEKPLTSFRDCLPYVSTTNAMFLSSGGIRSLPGSVVRRYENAAGGGVDVRGLVAQIERVGRTGKLFSELGISWASPGIATNPEMLREFRIEDFFSVPGRVMV